MCISCKKIYMALAASKKPGVFGRKTCPHCHDAADVVSAGRDVMKFSHTTGGSIVVERWFCGYCDKHFYTDFIDSD